MDLQAGATAIAIGVGAAVVGAEVRSGGGAVGKELRRQQSGNTRESISKRKTRGVRKTKSR